MHVRGANFSLPALHTLKKGVFLQPTNFRGKTSLQSQTKMAAVWAVNFDPILPITIWLPAPNGRFRVRNLSNDIKIVNYRSRVPLVSSAAIFRF